LRSPPRAETSLILLKMEKWYCRILVYSGLPDPYWEISDSLAKSILLDFDSLPFAEEETFEETLTGYRGCILKSDDGRLWRAFNGLIELNDRGKISFRSDKDRSFERNILTTAPPDILYKEMIDF